MNTPQVLPQPDVSSTRPGQVLFASLIGTTIEFFDFYIYATAAVLVFPRLFFPASDPASAVLASLATFGIAFLARPIGSALFGHFGDRIGRKATLVAALLTMGVSTVIIGLLPTYETIGIAAPALLALCRFGQGLGLGGEWGGAVLLAVENAPPGRRAWYGMFPQLGAPIGFLFSGSSFLALSEWLTERSISRLGLAHSLPGQCGARRCRSLRSTHDHRDPGISAGRDAGGACQSPDARRHPRASAHAGARHACLDRHVRPVLSDDGLRAVLGHECPRLQPEYVPRHSARRHRLLCAGDPGECGHRRTRTARHADLGHDRDRRSSAWSWRHCSRRVSRGRRLRW